MSHRSARHTKKFARLIATASLVVSILCILVGIIFFVGGPLRERQELRRNAMVPSGSAKLEFAPLPGSVFTATASAQFDVKVIPYSTVPTKAIFEFDLVTQESIDVSDVVFHGETGIKQEKLEFTKVDHGYHVSFAGTFPENGSLGGSNQPLTLLTVKFQPKKAGKIVVNFDRERSKLLTLNNNTIIDELRTQESFEYTVLGSPANDPANQEDLYFKTLDSSNTTLKFYPVNSSTEVSPTRLEPGRQYNIKHTSTIQNKQKATGATSQQVTVQLQINNNTNIRESVPYAELRSKSEGASVTLEGIFTAGEKNIFRVMIDPDNTFTEESEINNGWEIIYENVVTTGTGGFSPKQCNETCTSNNDCGVNQRCYNTGTDKRCRLATNVTSTTCSATPDQGLSKSCNEYCADTRECGSGFTCWYNKCRLLQNLESLSCTLPQAVGGNTGTTKGGLTTSTTPITYQRCNQTCTTNRDCSAGLRCYEGSCRNPLNLSNTSCTATGTGTTGGTTTSPVPTTTPGITPRPTISPTPTPILSTTPSPVVDLGTAEVTPTPSPDLVEMSDEMDPFSSFMATLSEQLGGVLGMTTATPDIGGIPLPYLIVGIGVLFLIIAIIIFILSRRKAAAEEAKKPNIPDVPLQTPRHNPQPTKEILAKRSSPDVSLIKSAAPVAPKPNPLATPTPVAPQPQKQATPIAATSVQPITPPPMPARPLTPVMPAASLAQPQPTSPNSSSTTPSAQPKQAQTQVTPASAPKTTAAPAQPAATPPAIIEHPLPAVPEKPVKPIFSAPPVVTPTDTTKPQPVNTSHPATDATLKSPEELLKQDAEQKVSMSDRLKMKGIEFTKEDQQKPPTE